MLRKRTYLLEDAMVDIVFRVKVKPFEERLYGAMIQYFLRRFGVTGLRVIVRKVQKGRTFGHVELGESPGKIVNLSVDTSAHYKLTAKMLAHEVTHVKQIASGDLEKKGGAILWKGEVVSDQRGYASRTVHSSMPFEIEAKRNEALADGFWSSAEFKSAAAGDPTLSYLLSSGVLP